MSEEPVFAVGQDGEAAEAIGKDGKPMNYHAPGQGMGTARRNSRWEPLENTKYKKRNRWGERTQKIYTPQTFSYIPRHLLRDEVEILLMRHRLDDLQRRLAIGDFETNDPDISSPSPEPIYDSKTGQRLNTKDVRLREEFNNERMLIIEKLMEVDKSFEPPPDYKPPKKYKKVYLPLDDPYTNYIGLILGPRGTTQKELEAKTNTRIAVRGRGSGNKGIRPIGPYKDDQNEPLHVLIAADHEADLDKAEIEVQKLIKLEQGSSHKQMQLMNLAVFNGQIQQIWCEACGMQGHKAWACPNMTKQIMLNREMRCDICGDRSHPTKDCPEKKEGTDIALRHEFNKFMRDIKAKEIALNQSDEFAGMRPKNQMKVLENPNNVMLVNDGKGGQKYINVQFGMADAWRDAAKEAAIGNNNYVTPTIPYAMGMMSTGQARGDSVMTPEVLAQLHKTDQYAALYYQTYTDAYMQQVQAGYKPAPGVQVPSMPQAPQQPTLPQGEPSPSAGPSNEGESQ